VHTQGLAPGEREWLEARALDKGFKEKLKQFKKHAHGTLVTGILLKEGQGIDVLPVRGIGIDVPTIVIESDSEAVTPVLKNSEAEFRRQVRLSEERIIRKMKKMLSWIHHHQIRIVNGSYGVSEKQILLRFAEWHKEITGLELDEERLKEIVDAYFESLYKRAAAIIDQYPQTLFVFSAGNSAQNNDERHHFPSRIRRPNLISVAATHGDNLAGFSNWGATNVDLAAPGVAIPSVVPSAYRKEGLPEYTPASGTSMAAPAVSNLAARCLQLNPKLKASQLKELLLSTGRALAALAGKTASGHIVDELVALKACGLTTQKNFSAALAAARAPLVAPEKDTTPDTSATQVTPQVLRALQEEDLDAPESATPKESSSPAADPATGTPDKSAPPAAAPSAALPSAPAATTAPAP
jgi:hypothetical protein